MNDAVKAIILVLVCMALGLALSGCATPQGDYAQCTIPTSRDAGMGVKLDGCAHWVIGRVK